MSRPVAVLRPEPGNAATAATLKALGRFVLRLPLFEIVPVAWDAPDPRGYDGLLLTSANAVRHAGPQLAALRHLPVHAVGAATARAAAKAGLTVATTGTADAAALLAQVDASALLHLTGREHTDTCPKVGATIVIYASEPAPLPPGALALLEGAVALLHSSRAAARLASLLDEPARAATAIVAISPAAARAAGPGWQRVAIAPRPDDATLIAIARLLAD